MEFEPDTAPELEQRGPFPDEEDLLSISPFLRSLGDVGAEDGLEFGRDLQELLGVAKVTDGVGGDEGGLAEFATILLLLPE